jgi:hypothetical protein
MKSSDALREARALLHSGRGVNHVCIALEAIGADKSTDVGRRLKRLFAYPYGNRSVSEWLSRQGVDISKATTEDFLSYRLRWIDWMIEGYERVGD